MRLDAFDYPLPETLIAQTPLAARGASRLMVVDRRDGSLEHACFGDLPRYLQAGDLIVINRSRVIPARLLTRRRSGGRVELLVLKIVGEKQFLATGQPLRKLRPGTSLHGDDADYLCRVVHRKGEREVLVEVTSHHTVAELLSRFGHVPLPPYIRRPDEVLDRERYQTVYACEEGSVAAPTAGLHITDQLLEELEAKGVGVCSLVLHVGLGTFLPLVQEVVEKNSLHNESYSIEGEVIERLRKVKRDGGRVIAVGTTTTRALESMAVDDRLARGESGETFHGETNLFIYPGYEFRMVDGLVTNFHLPTSSLLVLVAAFLGVQEVLECYRVAVDERYRFFSYGDAMFIK